MRRVPAKFVSLVLMVPATMRLLVPFIDMQTAAEIPFVGGDVAVDFVNTAEQRGDPVAEDVLRTATDLRVWGRRQRLLAPSATASDEAAELARATRTRELLHSLLKARVDGANPTQSQLDELASLASEAYGAAALARGSDGELAWRWNRNDLASVRHTAVASAVELLSSSPTGRLKECPGDHCGWLFLDTSKRGNRRWCSMSECGQNAKDEQRRARRRARSDT